MIAIGVSCLAGCAADASGDEANGESSSTSASEALSSGHGWRWDTDHTTTWEHWTPVSDWRYGTNVDVSGVTSYGACVYVIYNKSNGHGGFYSVTQLMKCASPSDPGLQFSVLNEIRNAKDLRVKVCRNGSCIFPKGRPD